MSARMMVEAWGSPLGQVPASGSEGGWGFRSAAGSASVLALELESRSAAGLASALEQELGPPSGAPWDQKSALESGAVRAEMKAAVSGPRPGAPSARISGGAWARAWAASAWSGPALAARSAEGWAVPSASATGLAWALARAQRRAAPRAAGWAERSGEASAAVSATKKERPHS